MPHILDNNYEMDWKITSKTFAHVFKIKKFYLYSEYIEQFLQTLGLGLSSTLYLSYLCISYSYKLLIN